jgi:hypothetical protein
MATLRVSRKGFIGRRVTLRTLIGFPGDAAVVIRDITI